MQSKRKSVPNGRRSGFTLVELLIVVIIIGILASGMILLSGSGQDRAEATRIISDLRTMVGAAQTYFTDHPEVARTPAIGFLDLQPYIDRDMGTFNLADPASPGYFFLIMPGGIAFVGFRPVPGSPGLYGSTLLSGPAKILAGEPEDSGLLGLALGGFPPNPGTINLPKYSGEAIVLRKAR